ncbi:MAG TPA: 30S ribosomal protein S13 [Candidatus Rubrimentiphilum sp.]|nr:30S ribosomal protein S13 [Candidatus Rubrimentiphilum sp.]
MARIAGIDLPREKRVEVALTYIFGIGPATARRLLKHTGVDPNIRVKDLGEEDEKKLRDAIGSLEIKVEGDLRRDVQGHIKRLVDIGCYRGQRHRRNLPVRGQRTKTNARTRKGPKKTVGSRKQKPTTTAGGAPIKK